MKEFKWWIFASLMMFAIAFIERAGRPLIYLAIALFIIGMVSWLETEYKEYENKLSTKRKRKKDFEQTMQITGDLGGFPKKKTSRKKQPRDSHGRFIREEIK